MQTSLTLHGTSLSEDLSSNLTPPTDSILVSIAKGTYDVVQNTGFNFWLNGISLIAIASLVLSGLTVYTIYKEFKEGRIARECQKKLFVDLIRHLYRNKICTNAMRIKYECALDMNANAFIYPSDEHYLKLQVLPEDIHLEQFYRDDDKFAKLHNIDLLLRNYNTEIEVAHQHMVDRNIPFSVCKRDFETLDFKTGYITSKIVNVMEELWPDMEISYIFNILENSHEKNVNDFSFELSADFDEKYSLYMHNIRADEDTRDWYLTKVFKKNPEYRAKLKQFWDDDIRIECGTNTHGEEKIYIIELL